MSQSLNRVELIGNAGKDAEVRYASSGTAVASFSVATSENYKNKSGEWEEKTEWHYVVVWGKLAEIAQEHVTKGVKLWVEGKLQTRKWQDRDGKDRYTTEIKGDRIIVLGKGAARAGSAAAEDAAGDNGMNGMDDGDVPY